MVWHSVARPEPGGQADTGSRITGQARKARCYSLSSDVQNAQRVAPMGMVEKQYWHCFVVGSAGGASSFRLS